MDWDLTALVLLVVGCVLSGLTFYVLILEAMGPFEYSWTWRHLIGLSSGIAAVITLTSSYIIINKKLCILKISTKKATATAATPKDEGKKPLTTQPQTAPPNCPYCFGYWNKRGNNASIPGDCLRCPRRRECFGSEVR